ncbi:hypothetical protein HME9302_00692 [Alteripontixanthobacter maritimus]|uniref:Lipoprotein n=1 Tax=Alteripontixanthobacter maritimus TaxID=2161824 RepID=A0A369Q4T9_9SPHN|nr:hypothetical protein [Alteripontixanthobacter maritimus]RDC59502.1 hypothetical protein HME9302_00692 [Alteripontixanthobacter maritimus]
MKATGIFRIVPFALSAIALTACGEPAPDTAKSGSAQLEATAAADGETKATSDLSQDPNLAQDYTERQAVKAPEETVIPERFRGTYGETRDACAQRNHGNFTITADRIDFFESNGEVQSVRVDGDYAAASIREPYADEVSEYVFYMALESGETLRFRYDKGERQTWVRCD